MSQVSCENCVLGFCYRKQASLWAEGDSCRVREMSKFQSGKAEKIAKAEKLEKEAWLEKMERQEKLRSSMRAMDPLEAHIMRKITADMDTMIMSSKHKEFEVRVNSVLEITCCVE